MPHRILGFTAFFLVATVSLAAADIYERDWNHAGDGLLTVDDVNMREWLDLTETQGMFVADISARLETEGEYAGFSIASVPDVADLATSAGIDTSGIWSDNTVPARRLIGLLGETGNGGFALQTSAGLALEAMSGEITTIGITISYLSDPDVASCCRFPGAVNFPQDRGIWLFRPVPEPSSALLFGLATTFLLPCLLSRRSTVSHVRDVSSSPHSPPQATVGFQSSRGYG